MTDPWKKTLFDFWENIEKAEKAERPFALKPKGCSRECHVPYLDDYHPMHLMNLYYPEKRPDETHPLPTVIAIHGGGYLFGTADSSDTYLSWIASQGYAVMAMNYRFLKETDLRGIVQDIFAAMHWLGRHGAKRGFDLGRVLLTGDSAGGHLTMLAAAIQQDPHLQEIYGVSPLPYDLTALCVCCPCAEMDQLYILGDRESERGRQTARVYHELLLGDLGTGAPWKDHMSAGDLLEECKLPPLFLIGSESESLHEQTRMLLAALDRTGQTYKTLIWRREDGPHLQHVFNVSHWEWNESLQSNKAMLDFFEGISGDGSV